MTAVPRLFRIDTNTSRSDALRLYTMYGGAGRAV
jgi:hypothetical protein